MKHELLERRLLVADAAGALAPHLPCAVAQGLLQLLACLVQDVQPQVRCHALAALAKLVATFGRNTSAFPEVLHLLLASAADNSADVTRLLLQNTLPAMLSWVGSSELVVTQLMPQVLEELHRLLSRCPAVDGFMELLESDGDAPTLHAVPTHVQGHVITLLQLYVTTLPAVRSFAFHTQPDWIAEAATAAVCHPQGVHNVGASQQAIASGQPSIGVSLHKKGPQKQQPVQLATPASVALATAVSGSLAHGNSRKLPQPPNSNPSEQPEFPPTAAAAASQAATEATAVGLPGEGSTTHAARLNQALEAAAIAAWVKCPARQDEWGALHYLAVSAVPALLKAALKVSPCLDAVVLIQRFVLATRTTCLAFGEAFAAALVAPPLAALAGISAWSATCPPSACTALQLLLAAVLPYCGPGAVGGCLRRLCSDGGSGSGQIWALAHPRAFIAAVRSAAEVQLVQAQLMPVLWELAASKQQGCRIASALLAGAAVPSLHKQQVARQLLPLLATLGSDHEDSVAAASVAAASVAAASLSGDPDVQVALQGELIDKLVSSCQAV